MAISRDPAASAADLNAALDAFEADLAGWMQPPIPAAALEQQDFSAFYHS
ncbi:MAG TPA: hypothetical protein VGC13_08960 [Longimicrobium sp.]|jgi:hypothetical protein